MVFALTLTCLWGVDMEILGWIVFLMFSICVTVSPVVYISISAIGGGMGRVERLFMLALFLSGCALIYYSITIAPLSIVAA